MRIAHVITRMILGGAQENTLLTCEDLQTICGDEVLLVTGPSLGPEGSLLERAKANRVPLAIVPTLRRSIHPWRDLVSYRAILRTLREFAPDVVHTHSAKGGFLGRLAAHALGVPAIIHTVHGAPFHAYQSSAARELFRRCERFAALRCHHLVSVADAMTNQLVAAGVAPREQFTTVYSGLEVEPLIDADSQRAAVRRQLGYEDHHVVIGKVARLFHLKGHQYVLRAAAEVVRSCPQARFLFVGDGILAGELKQQAAAAGLAEQLKFFGLAPPQQIPGLLAAMDVVVHTSLREGLARVLPQALIVGRPVVSYDIDGAREVVLPNETGMLLPPQSVAELSTALVTLVNDAALRSRLGAAGRRRFAEPFRHQEMTRRLREIYTRVLASSR